MSELTVSMPARNAERYIGEAIRSVLRQQGLDFELVVVEDGSTDNTANVVAAFNDPRVRLIRNKTSMGLAHCQNQVIEQSRSCFIAQVGPADIVLPEAFAKTVSALKNSAEAGLAHGYSFEIDEQGRITKDAFRARRSALIKSRTPGMDYKKALLFSEHPIDRFRVYRREALLAVGGFDETLTNGAEFDLELRLVDRFAITLVPEFLYAYRSRTLNGWMLGETLTWWQRYSLCRRRLKDNQTRFLHEGHYNQRKLLFAGLIEALKPKRSANRLKQLFSSSLSRFSRTFPFSLAARVYAALITRLTWRLPSYGLERQNNIPGRRIAYYTGHLPVQSWLAVEQELTELKNSALAVELIFDGPEPPPTEVEVGTVSLFERQEFFKSGEGLGWAYRKRFFLKNPVRCLNLLWFAMTRKHGRDKRLSDDLFVFAKAVDLALVLEEREIDHLHAPNSDQWAFIAFIAARLRGITYSMQAQGSEMRSSLLSVLVPELGAREFLIVNGPYKPGIAMGPLSSREDRIVIVDGLELKGFQSRRYDSNVELEMRILSIARPVEQSGLIHLVEALHILKTENSACHCEISTAPGHHAYTDLLIQSRKLRRRLELEDSLVFSQIPSSHELSKKLHGANVFILPGAVDDSAIDEFSPTLCAAMAFGMAVICANANALDGLVEDGVTGIVVPRGDARALATAIARLKTNPKLRKRLGESARKLVHERFDLKGPAETPLTLFRRVLGQTETGPARQQEGVAKL
ncbi:MAG: glycosyltransferase [Acidobacteriota bacterium]